MYFFLPTISKQASPLIPASALNENMGRNMIANSFSGNKVPQIPMRANRAPEAPKLKPVREVAT